MDKKDNYSQKDLQASRYCQKLNVDIQKLLPWFAKLGN